MAEKIAVNSPARLSEAIKRLTELYREKKYVVVSLRPGKDRTLDQNAMFFALYQRIAQMTQMGDVEDVRKWCKLHIGVPIMRKACEDFRHGWNVSFLYLTYEAKLEMMGSCALFGGDGFPVTRLFDRAQGAVYIEQIVAEFEPKGVVFDDILSEGAKE